MRGHVVTGERLPDGVAGNDDLTRRSGVLVAAVRRSTAAAHRDGSRRCSAPSLLSTPGARMALLGAPMTASYSATVPAEQAGGIEQFFALVHHSFSSALLGRHLRSGTHRHFCREKAD